MVLPDRGEHCGCVLARDDGEDAGECAVESPKGDVCSRREGHDGPHSACSLYEHPIYTWPAAEHEPPRGDQQAVLAAVIFAWETTDLTPQEMANTLRLAADAVEANPEAIQARLLELGGPVEGK